MRYLQSCLKGYDGKFRFENVVVLKGTMSSLPKSASERLAKQNLTTDIVAEAKCKICITLKIKAQEHCSYVSIVNFEQI